MANNLTPEQLAWLNAQPMTSAGIDPNSGLPLDPVRGPVTAPDGTTYIPTFGSMDGGWRKVQSGDPYAENTSAYYDAGGNYLRDAKSTGNSAWDKYAPFLIAAAPFALTAAGVAGAGGAGGGLLGSGATDYAALNAATDAALIDTATSLGGATAGSTAGNIMATGGGLLNAGTAAGTAAGTTAATTAATVAAPGLLDGAGKLLGPAATVLGAVAGSQSQENKTTTEKKMDPRLDPYVYGTDGIVPKAQGLMNQQMTPERMAEWAKIRQVGQGLLGQPIAGNGFNRFYGSK